MRYDWLLQPYRHYYIDMDLCDLNLNDYIHGDMGPQEDMQPFNNVRTQSMYLETVHYRLNCGMYGP